jgi:hypothetical protein
MDSATLSMARKICRVCQAAFKPEDMVDSKRYDHICRECAKKQSQVQRSLDVTRQNMTALKTFAATLHGKTLKSPHIVELSSEAFEAAGGVKQVAQEFVATMNHMKLTNPASRIVLDCYKILFKLAEAATDHRASAPDLSGMTDDELDNALTATMKAIVFGEPDVLKGLLEQSGYQVYLPDEQLPEGMQEVSANEVQELVGV